MATKYPELSTEYEIIQRLQELGIDVFEPETRFEESTAHDLAEFSSFVLNTGRDKCLEILETDLCNEGGSVGELQGGDDSFSIYRVSFPENEHLHPDGKCKNAAAKMLQQFHDYNQQTRRHANAMLTFDKIKQYMLGMCDRRTSERDNERKYISLENLMFILCFGEASGQVRHIDNMLPNIQICLYMSESCPSTIVYEMDDGDGPPVTDVTSLLDLWTTTNEYIPQLIIDILLEHGNTCLKSKWYTKYFGFWKTINVHLMCFGKLYQPVLHQLGLRTDPGVTLLAGGNEIHAGPPTTGPRMFAFAVGIPDPDYEMRLEDRVNSTTLDNDDNDGLIDYVYEESDPKSALDAKRFLVDLLAKIIRDFPMRDYLRQINEDRTGIRGWLAQILTLLEQNASLESIIEDAISSDDVFYSPDVIKQKMKKRKKARSKKPIKV